MFCKRCKNTGVVIILRPYLNGKNVDETQECHCSYGKINTMRKQAYTRNPQVILRRLMGRK